MGQVEGSPDTQKKVICALVRNDIVTDSRVRKEAQSLSRAGYEIAIIGLEPRGDAKALELDKAPREFSRLRRLRRPSRLDRRQSPRLSRLPRLLQKPVRVSVRAISPLWSVLHPMGWRFTCAALHTPCDAYHAHDLPMLLSTWIAARLRRKPLVYDSHELFTERNAPQEPEVAKRLWALVERLLIRRADGVVVPTEGIADELVSRYHIARPVVVRNAQPKRSITPSTILRDKLPVGDKAIVIYPGRLTSGRGLEQLIAAAPLLERSVVVLMGRASPGFQEHLQEQVHCLGVDRTVFFLPAVTPEEVHDVLCSADIGVMPTEDVCLSYRLGAGNKLFHFISAGLPCAVSDQPEKRAIVVENRIGVVFKPSDPADIARAINELTTDLDLYQRCAENSRCLAHIINWEKEAQKLLDLYDRLLQRG